MLITSKYKIAKRLGASVFEKTQSQKFAIAAERTAKNKKTRGRGPTEFGKQLLEKQKVRLTYGITERQFANYVKEAMSAKGANPAERLHCLLELRLDNVIYRLGLAPTRRAARQMVSHGHITVDGVKTTIPSRRVHIGDVIAVRDGSKGATVFANFAEKFAERPLLSWLTWDAQSMKGGVTAAPTTQTADAAGDLVSVISFYSR
ncbi:30S ribosomal protein S4 [Candidatus Parcubacteria bacterium]|nr:30S ribosomal protein S4 [Candidatus Parcubacteria bacterium]